MARERGVSMIWWVIVLLVLFLVAAFLGYDRYADAEAKAQEITRLKQQLAETDRRVQEELERRQQLSALVGFKSDPSALQSDPEAIRMAIENFKKAFADPEADAVEKTLEDMLKRADRLYKRLAQELATTQTRLREADSRFNELRAAFDEKASEHQQQVAQLTGEKQNLEQRLDALRTEKNQEIEQLRAERSKLREQLTTQAKEFQKQLRELRTEKERYENLAREAATHYASVRRNNREDGRIISRLAGGNRVFLDLGSRHGVKEGTAFEVFEYGKGNRILVKGEVLIQEVEPDYSVAVITAERDPLNPIAANDLVRNPLFQRGKRPKFFLMGDMTGRFTNQETERLIRQMGGEVVKTVTVDTDFIVLGRKESETAPPFESRPEWERAKLFNIEFIDAEYLLRYLGQ